MITNMLDSVICINTDISCLPDKVLHKIFVIYSDLLPTSTQILCSVSQRWRCVALGYSDLWRSISCDIDEQFPPTQLLKLWIERSRHSPIDVDVKSSLAKWQEQQIYLRHTLDLLLPHCHRWDKLVIKVRAEYARVFTGVTLGSAVVLKTVWV